MALNLEISPGSPSPIFRQIVEQVRMAVMTGTLSEGDQLPSVRSLAERLLVNPNTVARAYGELTRDGLIDGQQGRGVFIARPRQMYTRAERLRRISPLIDSLLHEGLWLGFSGEELIEAVTQKLAKMTPADPSPRRKTS
jgi:DNA-binding transcriptional regulator YhcF (GntR family)